MGATEKKSAPFMTTSIIFHNKKCWRHAEQDLNIRGLSKKYPTFGGEKYISYVTGLEP